MLFVKIHTAYRTVVALCDASLIGKRFEEGIKQLDVRDNFYREKEISEAEAIKLLKFQAKEDATFNIVGPLAVKVAQKAGVIDEGSVGSVDGVPFALVLL